MMAVENESGLRSARQAIVLLYYKALRRLVCAPIRIKFRDASAGHESVRFLVSLGKTFKPSVNGSQKFFFVEAPTAIV